MKNRLKINTYSCTLLFVFQILLQYDCFGNANNFKSFNYQYEYNALKNKNADSLSIKKKLYVEIGYGYGIIACRPLNFTIDNKNVTTKQRNGHEFLINIGASYFIRKYSGCLMGISLRKGHLEAMKMEEGLNDTTVNKNKDFSFINESIDFQSLVFPIHYINIFNIHSKYFALLCEYGLSYELPLNLKYRIDYKEVSSSISNNRNGSINQNKLKAAVNADIGFGILFKQKKLNFYIIFCGSGSPRSIISIKNNLGSFHNLYEEMKLGIVYYFLK